MNLAKLGGGRCDGFYLDVPGPLAQELAVPVIGREEARRRPRIAAADVERYVYRGTQHGVRFYRAAGDLRRAGRVALALGAVALLAPWAVAQEPAATALEESPPAFELRLGDLGVAGWVEGEEAPADEPVEPEPEPEPAAEVAPLGGLVAAAWCAVRSGGEPAEGEVGCDVGVGVSLWTWSMSDRAWWSVVVAIGTQTFVVGLARTVVVMDRLVSVGVGFVMPHGGGAGVDLDLAAPAVGANFGFGGGGNE